MRKGTTREIDLAGFVLGLLQGKKPEENKKDTAVPAEEKDDKDAGNDEEDRPITLKR
jgi:hypothetical protein